MGASMKASSLCRALFAMSHAGGEESFRFSSVNHLVLIAWLIELNKKLICDLELMRNGLSTDDFATESTRPWLRPGGNDWACHKIPTPTTPARCPARRALARSSYVARACGAC